MSSMAISTIDKELLTYFTQLDEAQKRSLLIMFKTFLKPAAEGVNVEAYNRELDEAMERISRGEFTSLDTLEKEMNSW